MISRLKKYLLAVLILSIIIIGVIQLLDQTSNKDNFFRIYRSLNNNEDGLLKDTLVKLESKSDSSLFIIKDNNEIIHFVMINGSEILLNSKMQLINNDTINSTREIKLEWNNTHLNIKKEYAFYGIIYDAVIAQIKVNSTEIPIYKYFGNRIFFSNEKFDTPILIEGYSNSGELIYRNFENENNK